MYTNILLYAVSSDKWSVRYLQRKSHRCRVFTCLWISHYHAPFTRQFCEGRTSLDRNIFNNILYYKIHHNSTNIRIFNAVLYLQSFHKVFIRISRETLCFILWHTHIQHVYNCPLFKIRSNKIYALLCSCHCITLTSRWTEFSVPCTCIITWPHIHIFKLCCGDRSFSIIWPGNYIGYGVRSFSITVFIIVFVIIIIINVRNLRNSWECGTLLIDVLEFSHWSMHLVCWLSHYWCSIIIILFHCKWKTWFISGVPRGGGSTPLPPEIPKLWQSRTGLQTERKMFVFLFQHPS